MFDTRSIRTFDWQSFVLIILLSFIGLMLVMSATYQPALPYSRYFYKQMSGFASGFALYFICVLLDYRVLQRWSYFFFVATIALLCATTLKGSFAMGAHRWINLGFVKFQPSELAKVFFPGFFSYYILQEYPSPLSYQRLLPILGILIFTFLLVVKQPDLGTALLILFSSIILLWCVGIPFRYFIIAGSLIALSGPITWRLLKPYQQRRILVFMGYGDAKKERYHLEQSKIAIGSGKLWGKGFLKGTQNKLQFLPESRTDSIFSVAAEEFGFLGSLGIILLFMILFVRLFYLIYLIAHPATQILALGLISHIIFSVIINIGMVIGLLPMVGIPLPFLSYGVTNLWIVFISLGWFQGIVSRRTTIALMHDSHPNFR